MPISIQQKLRGRIITSQSLSPSPKVMSPSPRPSP